MSKFHEGERVVLVPYGDQPMQRATVLADDGNNAVTVRIWPIDRPEDDPDGLRTVPYEQIRP